MAKKKNTKRKSSSSRTIKVAAAVVVLLCVAFVAAFGSYMFTSAKADTTIYIRRGITNELLTDSLTKHLGAEYAGKVMSLLRLTRADMAKRQGAFKVTKGESALRLARHLRGGAPSSITLTLNNIRTKRELADRIGSLYMMGRDSIWQALNDPQLCAKYGLNTDNIVCLMLPDTYDFYWDITTRQLLDRMHDYYNDFWTDRRRREASDLGLKPEEVVTVASIAEEESAKPDERGKIGRLYINRLHDGMRLQADPTVKFAIGDFAIRRITVAMTQCKSPYNTYRNQGLPPGPIRLPEKKTIDDILTSEPHNYMYMCAKEDFSGYHNFAATYEQHRAFAKKYQDALNKRGIK